MALIAKAGTRALLTEENALKGGTLGWMMDGDKVFFRCICCKKITSVSNLKQNFHDGRATCITCVHCAQCLIYIFAGMKSDEPRLLTGVYRIDSGDPREENITLLDDKGCPCGGTLVSLANNINCTCATCQIEKKGCTASGRYCLTCLNEMSEEA